MAGKLKLKSSDGEVVEVANDVIKLSTTIATMMESLEIDAESEAIPIPLDNVNAAILKRIIQWCIFHKDDPPAVEEVYNKEKQPDDICSWDTEFLKVDLGTLFELILASNYLEIKGLLNVTCQTAANMIKGKTPEEVRHIMHIKNDFTPEEEEEIRQRNAWCEN